MGNCAGKSSAKQQEEEKGKKYRPGINKKGKQKSKAEISDNPEKEVSNKSIEAPSVTQRSPKPETKSATLNGKTNQSATSTETAAPLASFDETNLRDERKKTKPKKQTTVKHPTTNGKVVTEPKARYTKIPGGGQQRENRENGQNPAFPGYEFARGQLVQNTQPSSSQPNRTIVADKVESRVDDEDGYLSQDAEPSYRGPSQHKIQNRTGGNTDQDGQDTTQNRWATQVDNGQETTQAENDRDVVNQDKKEKDEMENSGTFSNPGTVDESIALANSLQTHDWENVEEENCSRPYPNVPSKNNNNYNIRAKNVIIGDDGKIISNRKEHIGTEEHYYFDVDPSQGNTVAATNVIIGKRGQFQDNTDTIVDTKKSYMYNKEPKSSKQTRKKAGASPQIQSDPMQNVKPMDMKTVKTIAEASNSVGEIRYTRNTGIRTTGTVFRVGTDKVMTAWHIIRAIVYVDTTSKNSKKYNEKQLYQGDVTITFNYESANQNPPGEFHIKKLCYFNEEMDIAVLQLKETVDLPPSLKSFVEFKREFHENDSFYLIGHPYGNQKQMDPILRYWEPFPHRVKELNEWSCENFLMYGYTGMLQVGYKGISDKNRILFDCNFRHGASGSPGIVVTSDGKPAVITVLLRGFPSFYYAANFIAAEKERVPRDKLKQQGINMGAVHRHMGENNPDLAKEIFGDNESDSKSVQSVKDTRATSGEVTVSGGDGSKMVRNCSTSSLTFQKQHPEKLTREYSTPSSNDAPELVSSAAPFQEHSRKQDKSDEAKTKKDRLKRQTAIEHMENETNQVNPKPLGGTKPYGAAEGRTQPQGGRRQGPATESDGSMAPPGDKKWCILGGDNTSLEPPGDIKSHAQPEETITPVPQNDNKPHAQPESTFNLLPQGDTNHHAQAESTVNLVPQGDTNHHAQAESTVNQVPQGETMHHAQPESTVNLLPQGDTNHHAQAESTINVMNQPEDITNLVLHGDTEDTHHPVPQADAKHHTQPESTINLTEQPEIIQRLVPQGDTKYLTQPEDINNPVSHADTMHHTQPESASDLVTEVDIKSNTM